MNDDVARALLDYFEDRQYRLTRKPTRPGDLAAQRKDPVPAVARRLADLLAISLPGSTRPSEHAEFRQQLETVLLGILQQ